MPQLWRQFSRKGKQCLHGVTLVLIWHVLTEICAAMCFRICPYLFNSALTSVNLLKNDLGDDGLAHIATAWEQSSTLKSICGIAAGATTANLSQQRLGAADVRIVALELRFNRSLTSVNLLKNNLGDGAAGGGRGWGVRRAPGDGLGLAVRSDDQLRPSDAREAGRRGHWRGLLGAILLQAPAAAPLERVASRCCR